jgi:DNA-binding Lrp family transcriptional regulator
VPNRRQDGHADQQPVPSGTASSETVQAIARVRLPPGASRPLFEKQLQAIPGVRTAWHVTGDFDYEMRLTCRSFADLGSVLHDLRHCCDAEVASAGLVLGEVTGLAGPPPDRSSPLSTDRSNP